MSEYYSRGKTTIADASDAAWGTRGGDTAVEEHHLTAHLAGGGADKEDHAVRDLPRLSETAQRGAVDHGVTLLRLSVGGRQAGQQEGAYIRDCHRFSCHFFGTTLFYLVRDRLTAQPFWSRDPATVKMPTEVCYTSYERMLQLKKIQERIISFSFFFYKCATYVIDLRVRTRCFFC